MGPSLARIRVVRSDEGASAAPPRNSREAESKAQLRATHTNTGNSQLSFIYLLFKIQHKFVTFTGVHGRREMSVKIKIQIQIELYKNVISSIRNTHYNTKLLYKRDALSTCNKSLTNCKANYCNRKSICLIICFCLADIIYHMGRPSSDSVSACTEVIKYSCLCILCTLDEISLAKLKGVEIFLE